MLSVIVSTGLRGKCFIMVRMKIQKTPSPLRTLIAGSLIASMPIALSGCLVQLDKKMNATLEALTKPATPNFGKISFAQIDSAVIQPSCVTCHGATRADAGINISSYDLLMGSGTVVPGSAEKSSF